MNFALPKDTSKLSLIPPVIHTSVVNPEKTYLIPWWIELDKNDPDGHYKAALEFYEKFKQETMEKYRAMKNGAAGAAKTWKVKEYTVSLDVKGVYSCTCKGFAFRRECKHVNSVKTGVSIEVFEKTKPEKKPIKTVKEKSKSNTVLINPVDGKTYTVGQRGRRPEWAAKQMKKLGLV